MDGQLLTFRLRLIFLDLDLSEEYVLFVIALDYWLIFCGNLNEYWICYFVIDFVIGKYIFLKALPGLCSLKRKYDVLFSVCAAFQKSLILCWTYCWKHLGPLLCHIKHILFKTLLFIFCYHRTKSKSLTTQILFVTN